MPPRLDFSPFRTHYFFLATTVLAACAWASLCLCVLTFTSVGHRAVGSLWFAILLQAALNVGVLFAVATDSIQIARLQLATFGAIATVFAVQGTDLGVFSSEDTLRPMGAGYLVLAIVDILWVLYFTSEADSLALHLINHLGTGGLAPPSRRRRSARVSTATAHTTASKLNYALGSGIGSPDMGMHEPKPASIARSPEPAEPAKGGDDDAEEEPMLRARALHAYKGSPDDPNELSFEKGEVLEIEDQEGKWWQAKKLDGKFGIVPSNYLVMI
ncbi:hypothetical protein K438DRAFT_1850685 [Mycena galopus ATCC 62051]|nr:hypothetical protein K438DRAFT_1850685 [Mycena galopus ATCC 62051]